MTAASGLSHCVNLMTFDKQSSGGRRICVEPASNRNRIVFVTTALRSRPSLPHCTAQMTLVHRFTPVAYIIIIGLIIFRQRRTRSGVNRAAMLSHANRAIDAPTHARNEILITLTKRIGLMVIQWPNCRPCGYCRQS